MTKVKCIEMEVEVEVHPTINSTLKVKRTNFRLGNTIPGKDMLPVWVNVWGARVNEAWKWQWKAGATERDFEQAVNMLKGILLGA